MCPKLYKRGRDELPINVWEKNADRGNAEIVLISMKLNHNIQGILNPKLYEGTYN